MILFPVDHLIQHTFLYYNQTENVKIYQNTPGTAGGRDWTLAVTERWPYKVEKTPENQFFFVEK